MTGLLTPDAPADHVRVRLDLDPGPSPTLYFRDVRRFGRFLLTRAGDHACLPTLARMGPEPLSPDFTPEVLRAGLASRAAIKTHLLSQRPVAGLGNIYVDEALWAARIHPACPASAVSTTKTRRLHGHIVRLLERAVAAGGTTLRDYRTVAGDEGSFQLELNCYGRAGMPCPRCGRALSRSVLAQRSTTHCARCQAR